MEIPLRRNYCRSREMHENKTKHHPFALRCIVGRTFSRGLCRRVVARLEGWQTGQDARQLESFKKRIMERHPKCTSCSSLDFGTILEYER